MIIFVAYEGFELIANASNEIQNPQKNIPRAFYISVITVILLYMLISIITVGNVDEATLIKAQDYALAIAAKPSLGQIGFTLVAIAALLSTFSAINATIYGNARLGFIIAKDGRLPKILMQKKKETPVAGVIITLVLSLILANSIDLTEIAIIASAGFLLIFFVVNLSALKLHKTIDADKTVVICAIISSFISLVVLLYHTYSSNPRAVVIFLTLIIFSMLFELSYGRFRREHLFGRRYNKA